jgi:uncharacterized protein
MQMKPSVEQFLSCKRIAVVGASRDTRKFGYAVYTELKQRGYEVYAVNPSAAEVAGDPCYPDLAALKGKVDGVVMVVKPELGEPIVRQAAAQGIRHLWFQQGSETRELVVLAGELGMNVVSGKCILMYEEPVTSIHGFHRFFAKLFGQL